MIKTTKVRIRTMLADAYSQLGINSLYEIEPRIQEALDYLSRDREHYIEAAESDEPEYMITIHNGLICKLIPLAREIIRDQEQDHVREHTAVLSLMVTDEAVRYVYAHSYAKLYADSKRNSYTFPAYRYARLEDIRKTLQIASPQEIRPVFTDRNWEIYGMMFAAFDRFGWDLPINYIPHKTERAMMMAEHAIPEELTVDGKAISGKVIPLAVGGLLEELREDHRYERSDELCLLITEDTQQYLMKTRHAYHYFRKVICDDVPGGCGYEPTEDKQEITYQFVAIEDIRQNMNPRYF